MALNLPPDQAQRFREITEDIFGIPGGSIAKNPEAAAVLASLGGIQDRYVSKHRDWTRGSAVTVHIVPSRDRR